MGHFANDAAPTVGLAGKLQSLARELVGSGMREIKAERIMEKRNS